jgi:hypothetical protein
MILVILWDAAGIGYANPPRKLELNRLLPPYRYTRAIGLHHGQS